MLEKHEQEFPAEIREDVTRLRKEMKKEVGRVITTVEQLGTVKAVSLTAAAKLQVDAAMIALEHSIKLSPNIAGKRRQGPLAKFRAQTAARRAATTQKQRR